jgi:hypothetical protein
MVLLGNMCVDTVHKGDNDYDDDDNYNNNNHCFYFCHSKMYFLHPQPFIGVGKNRSRAVR